MVLGCRLSIAVPSSAEVRTGPGRQTLTIGAGVQDFAFVASGVAGAVSLFAFAIAYDPVADPYVPVADENGAVSCTLSEDEPQADAFAIFAEAQGELRLSFGDLSFPILNFARDGIIARCPVVLKDDAEAGEYPLECAPDADASSAEGRPVPITCVGGMLTVAPPPTPGCVGDQDRDGRVMADEATRAILAFAEGDSEINPAADSDGDGRVASSEATRAILNFGRGTCEP